MWVISDLMCVRVYYNIYNFLCMYWMYAHIDMYMYVYVYLWATANHCKHQLVCFVSGDKIEYFFNIIFNLMFVFMLVLINS